jgi:CRP-like cAMP-binding protein
VKEILDQLYKLNQEDYILFLQIMKDVHYKKGELILLEGQTCKGIYFLESGLAGLYKMHKDRKYYQDFFFEGTFATNIISLTANQPSEEYLVAIEDVKGKFIAKQALINLYQQSNDFKEFGRRLLEQLLADQKKLSFIRSSLTAKEKYEHILQEYPEYIQRVPLQLLASYLGMSRETLSRMRSSFQKSTD